MKEKSKFILGIKTNELIPNPNKYYSDNEKHLIIQELFETGCSKREIWKKYTGHSAEHGLLLRWMRKLGYEDKYNKRKLNFAIKTNKMKKKVSLPDDSYEIYKLNKRIEELEKQLKEAEMKAIAFSTMVDIAEKEFKIPIRKKFNTKP